MTRTTISMSKEKELDECAEAVKKTKDINIFIEFLEAFKSAEEEHIRNNLNPEDQKDFNLRQASLCAEAYAAAHLMKTMITKDK